MRTKGANGVGRFSVEFELSNYDDMALARRGVYRPIRCAVRRYAVSWIPELPSSCCRMPW